MAGGFRDKGGAGELVGKAFDRSLFRRLLGFAKPHLKGFVLSVVLLLSLAALTVVTPLIIGHCIDSYVRPSDAQLPDDERWAGILRVSAALFGIALLSFGLRYAQLLVINTSGQRVIHDLRLAIQKHILGRSLRFFDRNPVGTLVTRVTGDIETLNEFFISGLDVLVTDLTRISLITVILFSINWKMALVVLGVVPLILGWAFHFQRQARKLFRGVREEVSRSNAFMNETITGVRVIQLFRREKAMLSRFRDLNHDLRDAHLKTVRNFAWFWPGMEFLPALGQGLLLYLGNEFVAGGSLSTGELVSFWLYLRLFIEPLRQLADRYNILQAAVASGERVFKVLDDETSLPVKDVPTPLDSLEGEIRFENVSFSYDGRKPVLQEVDFHAPRGTHIAFVGPTGSGKTTIISLLSRFYDPDAGRILVDGIDLRDVDPRELRRNIGVVLQDVFLFAGTVRANLTLGRDDLSDEQLLEAAAAVQATGIIERLGGLDAELSERGSTLSTGEKQLLAFARTLAHDPAILVLDEATAHIDTETERLLQEAMNRLLQGRTALVIAHRLSTIQNCDRILVLHHGRIREDGTHQALLALDGIYARLHRMQFTERDAD